MQICDVLFAVVVTRTTYQAGQAACGLDKIKCLNADNEFYFIFSQNEKAPRHPPTLCP